MSVDNGCFFPREAEDQVQNIIRQTVAVVERFHGSKIPCAYVHLRKQHGWGVALLGPMQR